MQTYNIMDLKCFALILLGCILATNGQYGRRRTGRIPDWCSQRSSRIRCAINPCHSGAHNCPSYPNAVCINDDPCEPFCIGHYYTGRQRRLTTQECHAGGTDPDLDQDTCPDNSPLMRCFVNACRFARCPAYPNAECRNDNPCEPTCVGHFYDGETRLTRIDCRRSRRRNRITQQ